MKSTIYLAGPIGGLTIQQAHQRRLRIIRAFVNKDISRHFTFLDPCRDDFNPEHLQYDNPDARINRACLWDIDRSDLIFFDFSNSEKISKGSLIEVGYAFAHHKPMVAWIEKNNIHDHEMLRDMIPFRFEHLRDAVEFIEEMLVVEAYG
jgi:nucleoside 2-deoxyribosyltransferase